MTEFAILVAVYLVGLIVSAELFARRAGPGGEMLGCAAALWPVILPLEFAVRGAGAFGRLWSRVRRTWAAP